MPKDVGRIMRVGKLDLGPFGNHTHVFFVRDNRIGDCSILEPSAGVVHFDNQGIRTDVRIPQLDLFDGSRS